jgi:hypothetical protein
VTFFMPVFPATDAIIGFDMNIRRLMSIGEFAEMVMSIFEPSGVLYVLSTTSIAKNPAPMADASRPSASSAVHPEGGSGSAPTSSSMSCWLTCASAV